ncbi:hypothetical protein MKUB_32710 [Mycobacterium kubicae]|nr:hypothetical protein [Mycobacterium kubicae]GFG65781.1 hypothetical protein MKUB_32710 [Mycobacterium kubicae]
MTPTETPAPPTEGTVTEASNAFDIPKRSLHRAIERGMIPARKIGPLFVVDMEAARLYGEVFKARRALDAYTGRAGGDE